MTSHAIPGFESLTVELKREWTEKKDEESVMKTLVAFANTAGGDLYIGVEDGGSVVGINDVGAVEEHISSIVRDTVSASLGGGLLFTERLVVDGMTVLRVHVDAGEMKPYCLDPKNGGGIYIRVANTSAHALIDDIACMVRENSPIPYEKRPAVQQECPTSESVGG